MNNRLESFLAHIVPVATDVRREIHRNPETKFQEFRTHDAIARILGEWGIPFRSCAGTGIVAVIGPRGGRTVALRSDMDALPVPDLSGVPHHSLREGFSHACGHDGHIAILLGAAWILKQMEKELPGSVSCVWQPAEEGGAGAEKMILDGALSDPAPEAIFALHGWPSLPVGKAGYRFGPAMASTDDFAITVRGKGTHGAMPHAGVDPIAIAARVIEGVQFIRSRMINPLAPAVITIGTVHGGSAVNVIPDEVVMSGTIRTLDPRTRALVPGFMERMVTDTATASGGNAEFRLTAGYPPVINEERTTAFARDTIREILGPENSVEIGEPVMGGEDFAYYLEKMPGTFLRLGIGDRPPLHNSAFDFNDDAIPVGIRVMTGIAIRFLEKGLG
jgi:amidohydrolase